MAPAVRRQTAGHCGIERRDRRQEHPRRALADAPPPVMVESRKPISPPADARWPGFAQDHAEHVARVKPSVLSTPTSRTRSRTDMAMVLAETSRMVNITAAEMPIRNTLTLPSKETKPSDVSLLAFGFGLRGGVAEQLVDWPGDAGAAPGSSIRMVKMPAWPRRPFGQRLLQVFAAEVHAPRCCAGYRRCRAR